ncbi:MAG: hypothetical protein K2X82_30470 [Gemmataceae bacterium]|nr:hypothetical protein [Gemmataceae bacterium]
MPRIIKFPDEIKCLKKAQEEDPQFSRQYICRLPVSISLQFIRDCADRNTQPGRRIQEIVTEHYDVHHSGLHLSLPTLLRDELDAIAEGFGLDRTAMASMILTTCIPRFFAEAQAKTKERRDGLAELRRLLDKTT